MEIAYIPDARLSATLAALDPATRAEVTHAGAYALGVAVRRHVAAYARVHHATAQRLGAAPTGHVEKGAAAVTVTGDTVSIPVPGINRAFHALDVRPRTARALTIPIHRVAYGRRAGRLVAEGWTLFRTKGRALARGAGILYGRPAKDANPVALYLLRAAVRVGQDRALLPSDADMHKSAGAAVARAILRRGL